MVRSSSGNHAMHEGEQATKVASNININYIPQHPRALSKARNYFLKGEYFPSFISIGTYPSPVCPSWSVGAYT